VNKPLSATPLWLLSVCALLLGCGATAKQPIGYTVDRTFEPPKAKAPPPRATDPDIVFQARGRVRVTRLSDGQELSESSYVSELLGYEAVCAGEAHASAPAHYAEYHLLELLSARATELGLELGLGLEMWPREQQPKLTAYSLRHWTNEQLVSKTGYEKRWGYPFAYYRPQLERARELGVPLIALNASQELTRAVAQNGLDGLTLKQRRRLPEMDLNDAEHRARFERWMHDHPGVDDDSVDRFYAAQLVWDETMATASASWLSRHAPMRRMLILAGRAHCERTAIPRRLERRGARRVAAIWLGAEPPPTQDLHHYDYAVIVESGPGAPASPKSQEKRPSRRSAEDDELPS